MGPADKIRLARSPATWPHWKWCSTTSGSSAACATLARPTRCIARPGTIWDRFRNVLVGYVGSYGQAGIAGVLDLTIPGLPDAPATRPACRPVAAAVRSLHRLFIPAGRVGRGDAAIALARGAAARPGVAARRRRFAGPRDAGAEPLGLHRTRETALGNLRLMQAFQQQLHVPAADCKAAAESLSGGQADLSAGWQVRLSPGPRRSRPLDLDGPGGRGRRWVRGPAAAGLRGPAVDLVPRPGPRRDHD